MVKIQKPKTRYPPHTRGVLVCCVLCVVCCVLCVARVAHRCTNLHQMFAYVSLAIKMNISDIVILVISGGGHNRSSRKGVLLLLLLFCTIPQLLLRSALYFACPPLPLQISIACPAVVQCRRTRRDPVSDSDCNLLDCSVTSNCQATLSFFSVTPEYSHNAINIVEYSASHRSRGCR